MAPDLAKVPERLRPGLADAVAGGPAAASSPARACRPNFPENPEENAFPEILGGDQAKQIEAVRSYLLTFGRGGQPAAAPAVREPAAADSSTVTAPATARRRIDAAGAVLLDRAAGPGDLHRAAHELYALLAELTGIREDSRDRARHRSHPSGDRCRARPPRCRALGPGLHAHRAHPPGPGGGDRLRRGTLRLSGRGALRRLRPVRAAVPAARRAARSGRRPLHAAGRARALGRDGAPGGRGARPRGERARVRARGRHRLAASRSGAGPRRGGGGAGARAREGAAGRASWRTSLPSWRPAACAGARAGRRRARAWPRCAARWCRCRPPPSTPPGAGHRLRTHRGHGARPRGRRGRFPRSVGRRPARTGRADRPDPDDPSSSFGDVVLEEYESGITYPAFQPHAGRMREGTRLRFRYDAGSDPRFRCSVEVPFDRRGWVPYARRNAVPPPEGWEWHVEKSKRAPAPGAAPPGRPASPGAGREAPGSARPARPQRTQRRPGGRTRS